MKQNAYSEENMDKSKIVMRKKNVRRNKLMMKKKSK